MSWTRKSSILVFLALAVEMLFLNSYDWDFSVLLESKSQLDFFLIYQLLIVISFLLIANDIWLSLAITILLLFASNLIWAPDNTGALKTLPPNYLKRVEVIGDIGDVMPGFKGVNEITTDERGFRSSRNIDYDNDRTTRIFTIGASTTEEIYTDDSETWSALLQKRIEKNEGSSVEVVNTGASGLRAIHHASTQEYVSRLHPDLMIFLVGVNDWNYQIKTEVDGPNKDVASQILPSIYETILFRAFEMVKHVVKKSFGVSTDNQGDVVKDAGEYYSVQYNSLSRISKISLKFREVSSDFESNMSRIAESCNAQQYACMFVTQPNAYSLNVSEQLKKRFWMTPTNEEYTLDLDSLVSVANLYNEWLLKFGSQHQIPVCDLASNIPPSILYFYDDVHFNELGSTKVSEIIFQCINENFPQFTSVVAN